MKKGSVKEAITTVLIKHPNGLTASEIYQEIAKEGLFEFKSATPVSIVTSELRKSLEGLELKKSLPRKLFRKVGEKYSLLK